jgi:hypothetical protein
MTPITTQSTFSWSGQVKADADESDFFTSILARMPCQHTRIDGNRFFDTETYLALVASESDGDVFGADLAKEWENWNCLLEELKMASVTIISGRW